MRCLTRTPKFSLIEPAGPVSQPVSRSHSTLVQLQRDPLAPPADGSDVGRRRTCRPAAPCRPCPSSRFKPRNGKPWPGPLALRPNPGSTVSLSTREAGRGCPPSPLLPGGPFGEIISLEGLPIPARYQRLRPDWLHFSFSFLIPLDAILGF